MEQTITKLENKWILHPKTDEELKEIAKDLYNGKIFSDRHLSQYDRIESHFMVMKRIGGYLTIKETSIQKQTGIQLVWKSVHKLFHLPPMMR